MTIAGYATTDSRAEQSIYVGCALQLITGSAFHAGSRSQAKSLQCGHVQIALTSNGDRSGDRESECSPGDRAVHVQSFFKRCQPSSLVS